MATVTTMVTVSEGICSCIAEGIENMSLKKYMFFHIHPCFSSNFESLSVHATVVNTSRSGHYTLHRVTEAVHAFTPFIYGKHQSVCTVVNTRNARCKHLVKCENSKMVQQSIPICIQDTAPRKTNVHF